MDTPKPCAGGSNEPGLGEKAQNTSPGVQVPRAVVGIESALRAIRPEIRRLEGYKAPPQGQLRAKLNQNENPYDIPEEWKKNVFEDMRNLEWTRYPAYNPPPLREALAKRFGIATEQILVGGGSNQLLYMIGMAVIGPGDGVLVTPPSFGLFELIGRIFKGKIIASDLNPDFSVNDERMVRCARQSKLAFICSPNNPTGNTMRLDLLESMLNETTGLILWDEAYAEFCGKTALPLLDRYPNLLVLRTFSKAFGLAGLRIGYLMGHASLIAEFSKVNIPYNVNLFSALVARRMLDENRWMEKRVEEIVRERDRLYRRLKTIPEIETFPSEANFILIRFPDSGAMFEKLREKGVLLRAVDGHPLLKNCLRATVGTPEENRIFIEVLKETLKCGD